MRTPRSSKFIDGTTSLRALSGVRSPRTPSTPLEPGMSYQERKAAEYAGGGEVGLPGGEQFRSMFDPAMLGGSVGLPGGEDFRNPAALGAGGPNPLMPTMGNPASLFFGDALKNKFESDKLNKYAMLLHMLRSKIMAPGSV